MILIDSYYRKNIMVQPYLLVSVFLIIAFFSNPSLPQIKGEADACNGRGTNFSVAQRSPTGVNPSALAIGDFNGDHILDAAVADLNATTGVGNISIYLGDGKGAFTIAGYLSFEGAARNIVVGDFNGDGKDDLAFAGMSFLDAFGIPKIGVGIALGQGDGRFSQPLGYGGGGFVVGVTSADYNRDGKLDIAAIDGNTGQLLICQGQGDGTFSPPVALFSGGTVRHILSADFNKDGSPDIAVNNWGNGQVAIFIGNGSGGFNPVKKFDISTSEYMTTFDSNHDGNLDIIYTTGQSFNSLLGDGKGNFLTYSYPLTASSFGECVAGDFNGDGKSDIAFVKPGRNRGGIAIALANPVSGYGASRYVGAGYSPASLAAGDFNRDGKLDLLTINTYSNDLSFFPGDGSGNFPGARIADTGNFINSFIVRDLNQDGLPEVVVTDNTNKILLSVGTGDLSFEKEKEFSNSFSINGFPYTSIAEDFNQDGKIDLIVLNQTPINYIEGMITFLPDIGSPILELSGSQLAAYKLRIKSSNTGAVATDMRNADFNGDGKQDLVLANSDTNQVTIMLGNGTGAFTVAGTYPVGINPRSLTITDSNGDGKPDVVVANRGSAGLWVLLNAGGGSFSISTVSTSTPIRQVVSGDVNLDGKNDLVVVPINTPNIFVYLGNGNGTFGNPQSIPVELNPYSIALGDFTGDGKLDFALARSLNATELENKISIYNGNGMGGFARGQEFSAPEPARLLATDFNQDGLVDLAVATASINGTGGVWLFRNECRNAVSANATVSVNAASYTGSGVAPGAIASAFGTGLSESTQSALVLPLPTQLSNTTVLIRDSQGKEQAAPLFFVSPFQVNYQMPATLAPGVANVTITNGNTKFSTGTILITATTPGVFAANADGSGVAAANLFRVIAGTQDGRYEAVAQFDPLSQHYITRPLSFESGGNTDTLYLLLYGTGIRGRTALSQVTAKIWEYTVPVEYAGSHCCFVGVDQINIKLPLGLRGRGEIPVVLSIDGKVANTVLINIQ
jgi:uncharacterized protein (TIGR03437 family)